ncbi:25474_t:CDS:2, partial [Dentiscutata erythropus]
IVTDHEAIPWLKKHKQPKGRLARWIIHLSEYEPYNIIKRKGSDHTNADALSRLETNPVDKQNFNPIENFEESLNRRISALKGIFIDAQIINHRNIQHAQELQRNRQQNLKKAQTYEVNDIILLYDSAKQHVHGDKFSIRWNGPFWIQSKLGNNTYLIRDKLGRILQKPIHAEKMKHYKQRYLVEPHVVIAS